MRWSQVFVLYVFWVPFVPCHSANRISIAAFATESTGEWETFVDRRDLLVMSHDWVPSATGGFAQAKVRARIPEGTEGPYRLSLYQSDDYFNDFWRAHNDSWLGGDGFFGHRFKQVWLGDELLWESDVADANPPQAPGQIVLDLPKEIQSGDSTDITLRVVDKVSSWIELASDTQHISTTETAAEKPGDPAKFWTHVYWGDVSILSAGEEPMEPVAPIAKVVEQNHQKNWPPPPYGDPDLNLPLEFTLDCAAPLPECGYPVRSGIPLPKDLDWTRLKLSRSKSGIPLLSGREILWFSSFESIARGPHESPYWATTRLVVHPGDEGRSFSAIEPEQWIRFETVSPPFMLEGVEEKGSISFKLVEREHPVRLEEHSISWSAEVQVGGNISSPTGIEPDGPDFSHGGYHELEVSLKGQLDFSQANLDPLQFDLSFANKSWAPILTSQLRLSFPHAHSKVEEVRLTASFPLRGKIEILTKGIESGLIEFEHPRSRSEFVYICDESKQFWVGNSLAEAPGKDWIVLRDGFFSHLFAIRHLTEAGQAGFRVIRNATDVTVQSLVFTNQHSIRGYPYTAGEAKTFEVLYAHLPRDAPVEEFEKIAANFERPPILVNNDHLCRSGAFGYALPPGDGVADEILEWLKKNYPDPLGKSLIWGNTPRDFGDTIYNATNSWRNGYYDLRQGFVAAYLLSGNREWADALDRAVQHYVDVDTIHSSTDHPDHVGLAHGYGENHTSMDPWNPILRMNGVLAAAHIWGNDQYYEAAMTMARKIAETGRGLGSVSVRDHAGVMMSFATAYRETRDPLFKEAGEKLIEDIMTNRVDTRRGTYPEVHGNWNYRGNVPWMVAQLIEPLYLFYRETGNLDAAKLVVGFAESILCENQTRGVPGDIFGYSHNPHFTKSSSYHVLIAPCLFYAFELTGDEDFKEAAIAAWERTRAEGTFNAVQNCFWNTPTLVYYLRKYANAK